MATLTEMAAQIIAARAATQVMTTEEFQKEMQIVYNFLKGVEAGDVAEPAAAIQEPEAVKPHKINFKKVFKDNAVVCLICNKEFKTLKRHLTQAHQITDKEYRTQFNIPKTQPLIAKKYSEERKKAALDRGQGEILAKAREARKAAKADAPAKPAKAPKK